MPRDGSELFQNGGVPLNRTLLDFWRWSSSDLVGNTLRGILAEYIVACALGITDTRRVEWDAFDLKMPNGTTLEIKSAAYLQSWQQKAPSQIKFGIAPTRAWDEAASKHTDERKRQANLYVFCLLHHQDKATVEPLDMSQWMFYLLASATLDAKMPMQKSITLASLLKMNPAQCAYQQLAEAITERNWQDDTDT